MAFDQVLHQKAFINGASVDSSDGAQFAVINPATGETITQISDCTARDAEKAIASAKAALKPWAAKTAKERCEIMRRWFDIVIEHEQELAELLSTEQGKPLAEALGEIRYGAAYIEWFAEEARRTYGDLIPSAKGDARILVMKQPVGVVAAITPWNFPNAMIARKAAPALAAGCPIVIKPAEDTPLSALALAQMAKLAGVPEGVINIVTTSKAQEVGQVLTTHQDVAKVSFTGSTEVGRIIMRNGAETIKKLSLELGGNAPFIVFDDADLDRAVDGALMSKYRNSGQTCVCANRIYVQAGIYDAFVEKFSAKAAELKVGGAFESDVALGPLINTEAVAKVEELVADAIEKGASATIGGSKSDKGDLFYNPTILRDVSRNARVLREEIFGPVAPVIKFKDEADAITLANDSEFGLAGYFFSKDLGRVWRVAEALECGIVGVNEGVTSAVEAPFGGVKQSGLGREGSHYGLDDYLELKYVLMGGLAE
ncbi:succinate-semialdehyde dehydrogenase/glutarate-semialdehyde dehydrogenase [Maritalea mobilis]|uniref:Succinate-semialdehyde dehydrogenase/glutarate-semialdehyde dehydrogenase n=1 Tax=Maritalea mobilis TaxID=483324 RepID=A0A4R6VPB3_9HYPH|nr:NAD-dependent succinate-semialdehyde dehydrogenase [Maritalea mobilis]TDQ64102.1 succinate-semialdehyde dehydrogenase/glutarate-semialdehyde dehydrogenase [Maritalea mobilis]